MSKVLQCPHFISYGGLTKWCLLGYFPVNCEACACPDKHYIEIFTTTSSAGNSEWPNYLKGK